MIGCLHPRQARWNAVGWDAVITSHQNPSALGTQLGTAGRCGALLWRLSNPNIATRSGLFRCGPCPLQYPASAFLQSRARKIRSSHVLCIAWSHWLAHSPASRLTPGTHRSLFVNTASASASLLVLLLLSPVTVTVAAHCHHPPSVTVVIVATAQQSYCGLCKTASSAVRSLARSTSTLLAL